MARLYAQELAFYFESVLKRRLRGRKNIAPIIDDIVREMMEQVPTEAFDAKVPADQGYLFWTGDTTDESALEMQLELMSAHLGLKVGVPIQLLMSNCGGFISSGMAVISTIYKMRRDKRVVNVTVSGDACSMGSVILQAADRRLAEEGTLLMIHNPSMDPGWGRIDYLDDAMRGLRIERDVIFAMYAHRSGKPVSYWRERMERREVYMTAKEALSEGLIDEVLKRP
jgi:ATP-dependent protease ClpP protease subunit